MTRNLLAAWLRLRVNVGCTRPATSTCWECHCPEITFSHNTLYSLLRLNYCYGSATAPILGRTKRPHKVHSRGHQTGGGARNSPLDGPYQRNHGRQMRRCASMRSLELTPLLGGHETSRSQKGRGPSPTAGRRRPTADSKGGLRNDQEERGGRVRSDIDQQNQQ